MNFFFKFLFRSQTTKGIWIAHCVGIEPCTIAMDLEGTDGRERGEVIGLVGFSGQILFLGLWSSYGVGNSLLFGK